MFSYKTYVPVLKWKMGEYQALEKLSDEVKAGTVPLIEIPPIGFDFAAGQQRKTVDDHLADFGTRLKAKWDSRHCMVDLHYISQSMANGQHCVETIFQDIRKNGCDAVPVIRLKATDHCVAAVASVVRTDQKGVCLRLVEADFDRVSLLADIEALLSRLGITYAEADLVLDLAFQTYESITTATHKVRGLGAVLGTMINRWRSLAVVASSFPASIAVLRQDPDKPQFASLPRSEWTVYVTLVKELAGSRIPAFGDYAASNPALVELDMRLIKPFAKLRYTYKDHWHIAVGKSVRSEGFGQYRTMCTELMRQPYFAGANASEADSFIADCASGNGSTGNLSTWVWVATNRHVTQVHSDLANFHGLSIFS